MIRYKIYQNQQQKGLNAGKWFARAVSDETFDLAKLAEHMSKHNSPYSGGVIKGVQSGKRSEKPDSVHYCTISSPFRSVMGWNDCICLHALQRRKESNEISSRRNGFFQTGRKII